jgi:hypothetical protein
VQKDLDDLIPLVKEANIAAEELNRQINFKTKLSKKFNKFLNKWMLYPIIVVDNKEVMYKYEWTEYNFKIRLQKIRELLDDDQVDRKT